MTTKDVTNLSETFADDSSTLEEEESTEQINENVHQPSESGSAEETREPESEEDEEDTIENFLSEESITIKKTKKYPEASEGDVVLDGDTYEVRAKHVSDDIETLFGENPNPKLFFSIYNNTPKKADAIAKACGWRTRHYAKAAIEDLISAKTEEDRNEILEADFPEWIWAEDAEKPFRVNISDTSKQTASVQSLNGKLPWGKDEISRAVNDYVADNPNVSKEAITKSAKVVKLLEEFSGFQKDGRAITANEALRFVIPQVDLAREPVSKKSKSSIGGGKAPRQAHSQKGVTPGMQSLLDQAGIKLRNI